jgi:hypothetical protein
MFPEEVNGKIPWNPCAFPCVRVKICGFWAEFAEFRASTEKIRC